MATYNTAYKSGTFSGAPSSGAITFTVAGFTPAAGDVGRLVIITSGSGRLQHREIIAVSGQNITIAHAWDTNPFIDPTSDARATDVLPSSGDAVAVSYLVDASFISSDGNFTLSGENNLAVGATVVSGGAYIFFKNYDVEFASDAIEIGTGGGLIFGYYNYVAGEDGYVKDVCNITDTSTTGTGGNQMGVSATSFGLLDMYGSNLYIANSNVFWRCYREVANSREVQIRFINCVITGGFGSRTDGDRSMLIITSVGAATTFGISNPRSAVARIEFTALNCDQGAYVWLSSEGGASGRAVFSRIADINSKLLRVVGHADGAGQVFEVAAKKNEIDATPLFAQVSGSSVPTHILRYGNLVKPSYIDATGSSLTGDIKTRLYDGTDTLITENTITDAQYVEEFVRHTDIPSTVGNKTLASGTQYAPYSLRSVQYGKQFAETVLYAEDTFSSSIIMFDDALITEATKATVEAYPISVAFDGSTITVTGDSSTLQSLTTAQLYDFLVSWLEDNITDEQAFLVTRTGTEIDAGLYNLILDYIAFTGSIKATGTVTLSNGSTVSGTIIDSTADSALVFSGVDSWIVYANATDQDANTNALGSGTTGGYRFNYSASTTYYMRLTTGTDTLLKTVTPTGSGETEVSLTTAGLLTAVTATVTKIDTKLGFVPPIVFCDPDAATNGSGSGESPFNNIAAAVTQALAIGATEIDLEASTALTAAASGVNIKSVKESLSLGLNGQDITGSKLEKLLVYGSCVTTGSQLVQCYIGYPGLGGVSGYRGLVQGFILKETLSLGGNTTIVNGGTEHGENNTIEVNAGNSLSMTQITGDITVANVEAGSTADINFTSGHLTIDSSCTAGTIRVRGNATVTDNSAGTTVTDETINNLSSADVTAAIPSEIDANIIKVNSVPVDGAGTKADPFGPA